MGCSVRDVCMYYVERFRILLVVTSTTLGSLRYDGAPVVAGK